MSSCSNKRDGRGWKVGPLTANPFLNFMREFRRKAEGSDLLKMGKEAGKRWRHMSADEKSRYRETAESVARKLRKKNAGGDIAKRRRHNRGGKVRKH